MTKEGMSGLGSPASRLPQVPQAAVRASHSIASLGQSAATPHLVALAPPLLGVERGVVLLCSPGSREASLSQRGWLRSRVCAPSPGQPSHAGNPVNQVQPAQQLAFYFLN